MLLKITSKYNDIIKYSRNEFKINKIIKINRRQILGVGLVFSLKLIEFQHYSNPTLATIETPIDTTETTNLCSNSLDISYICLKSNINPSKYIRIETTKYGFEVPFNYKLKIESKKDISQNPLIINFASEDGYESLSLYGRIANEIKPSFFQISDISKFGDLNEVAKYFIPKGSKLISSKIRKIKQSPVDTGTLIGVITLDDITIYNYEFDTVKGVSVGMGVAASNGYIYVFAISAEKNAFNSNHENFENILNSFTLFKRINAS